MAVFITAVYVGIVVGVGALVGSTGSPLLSAVAAAIVAIAFQPARRWAQRFADRLVYGKRATPYEVLSAFSERLASAYGDEDLLPRMARILGEGTAAERADVWLKEGDRFRPVAGWPTDAPALPATPVDGAAGLVPVRHQGELLGALSITKRPGEQISPTEDRLIADLASQAGLVLRNAALIADLRSSRQRLVAAQDEERRKIERNLHDGAQQQLVALAVQLKLARTLIERDPTRAGEMLDGLQGSATERARGPARPRARDLSAAAGRQGAGRRARRPGAQGRRPRHGGVGRPGPVPARGRVDALLLRARGAEQRREVRRGLLGAGAPRADGRARLVRGDGRRTWLRPGDDRLRDGPAGYGRPPRRLRRRRSRSDRRPAPARPSPARSRWDRRRRDRPDHAPAVVEPVDRRPRGVPRGRDLPVRVARAVPCERRLRAAGVRVDRRGRPDRRRSTSRGTRSDGSTLRSGSVRPGSSPVCRSTRTGSRPHTPALRASSSPSGS